MFDLDLNGKPPQPKSLDEAQQMIDALWLALREATMRSEKLEEQLNTDSSNSSKPPSSDSPQKRAERPKKPRSNRPRGAQPGHPKHDRVQVSETEVDEVQRFFPEGRCECGGTLWMQAEPVLRHQVFDLPEVRYQVTEYQLYAGDCPIARSAPRRACPNGSHVARWGRAC